MPLVGTSRVSRTRGPAAPDTRLLYSALATRRNYKVATAVGCMPLSGLAWAGRRVAAWRGNLVASEDRGLAPNSDGWICRGYI